MTYREMLINFLSSKDHKYDSIVTHYIDCPFVKYEDCQNPHKYGTPEFRSYCNETCKVDWLDMEIPD